MKFDIQRFIPQTRQSVHSGSTIFLKVNGKIIGRAQALDGRRSFGTEGVYELGSIMPQEHVNNRYEGTVSLERFLIRKNDLARAGLAALGEEILTRDIIDIEVISKYTGQDNSPDPALAVRVYRGCTCVDYTETFRVGAIAGENATFQYLSCDMGDNKERTDTMNGLYNSAGASYYATTTQATFGASTSSGGFGWDTTSGRLSQYEGRVDNATGGTYVNQPENGTWNEGLGKYVWSNVNKSNVSGYWNTANNYWVNLEGTKYYDYNEKTGKGSWKTIT